MDLQEFAIDPKKAEGVWIDAGKGTRLLVARWGNRKFQAAIERMTAPYQTGRRSSIPEDVADRIATEAMARHILLGWENLLVGGQSAGAYTPELAKQLLSKYERFAELVMGYAKNEELFKQEQDEEVEKNS